jgi:uncharacterized protein YcfJ
MLNYAESKLPNLYEPDNGSISEKDASIWDKNFLYQVKNELERNFSREKLKYYEVVAKEVLKDKARLLDEEENVQKVDDSANTEQHNEKKVGNNKKYACIGIAAGGVALATIGICTSKALVTTLGVAGFVAGGYMLYRELKNK